MKKIIIVVVGALALLLSSQAGQIMFRQKTGEDSAHGFVLNDHVRSYDGSFQFERFENGESSQVNGGFNMNSRGEIVLLAIDDEIVVAPGDEPITFLPVNTRGETRHFYLRIRAIADDNREIRHGTFKSDLLERGAPITIMWEVTWQPRFMAYTPPQGVPTGNLGIQVNGEYSGSDGYYDEQRGGLVYHVDPSEDEWDYQIYTHGSDAVHETGTIRFDGTTERAPEHPLNFWFENNVLPFHPGAYLYSQQLQSFIVDQSGREIPAAIFFGSTDGEFYVTTQGLLAGSVVQVKVVNAFNNLELWASQTVEATPRTSVLRVPNSAPRKFVVTITGAVNPNWSGFAIWFPPFDPNDPNGGRGVAATEGESAGQ